MPDRITKTIIVKAPAHDCYELWADFENFPKFMNNVKSVTKTEGTNSSHWVVEGPLGNLVEWDARMTTMEPDTRLAWNSTGGDIETSGMVTFTVLGEDSTQITVVTQYEPHQGKAIGRLVAKLFVNPDEQLEEDLMNFKAYAEDLQRARQTADTDTMRFDYETAHNPQQQH